MAEHLVDETALFEASTDNVRVAIDMVKAGNASLLEIYPEPLTKAQADAIEEVIAEWETQGVLKDERD